MFKTREEELIIRKHLHKEMMALFRDTLTKVSNLKQNTLDIQVTSRFLNREKTYEFEITVFGPGNINTSLSIYDFWEIDKSKKLVAGYLAAIKTGDFEKVKAADCRL